MTELLSARLLGGKNFITEPLGTTLQCVFLEVRKYFKIRSVV